MKMDLSVGELNTLAMKMEKGDEQALVKFRKFYRRHPRNPLLIAVKARYLLINKKDPHGALEHFNRAANLGHPHPDSFLYGRIRAAVSSLSWELLDKLVPCYLKQVKDGVLQPSGLFQHLSMPGLKNSDYLMLANAFISGFKSGDISSLAPGDFTRLPARGRRLRVGYMSSDFKVHPVTQLLVQVLEHHDKTRFETIAYDLAEAPASPWRSRILATFDGVVPCRDLSDIELAERIRSDELDILVDLNGDTAGTKVWLCRHRLAPVQMTWLGFGATLGEGIVDYQIQDLFFAPEEIASEAFSEKLIWLPHHWMPVDTQRVIPPPPIRRDLGLPEDKTVYCCFNGQYKISRESFDAWMCILKEVENSVLWLYGQNKKNNQKLQKEAAKRNIDPARLIFSPGIPHLDHLSRLQQADIALDTWPYTMGTTAMDTLWARVPLVTFTANAFSSRGPGSKLHNLRLDELIQNSVANYIDMAVVLGKDEDYRTEIRTRLEQALMQSPLFDMELFSRHLEKGYELAFYRYENGLNPDHIKIPDLSYPDQQSSRCSLKEYNKSISTVPSGSGKGELLTESVHVKIERAQSYLRNEKLVLARREFSRVLNQDSLNGEAFYGLGLVAIKEKNFEQALVYLKNATEAEPDNEKFTEQYCLVQNLAQQDTPTFVRWAMERAKSYHRNKKMRQAAQGYVAVLERAPHHAEALHYLGLAEMQAGHVSGMQRIRLSMQLEPHNLKFQENYRYAQTLLQKKDDVN